MKGILQCSRTNKQCIANAMALPPVPHTYIEQDTIGVIDVDRPIFGEILVSIYRDTTARTRSFQLFVFTLGTSGLSFFLDVIVLALLISLHLQVAVTQIQNHIWTSTPLSPLPILLRWVRSIFIGTRMHNFCLLNRLASNCELFLENCGLSVKYETVIVQISAWVELAIVEHIPYFLRICGMCSSSTENAENVFDPFGFLKKRTHCNSLNK